MAVKNKAEFETKYGAAPSESQNVLIGMKGGKAVYGTEMESKDTKGENVINNTYSQNQAIMNDIFKEMGRSGGMYNPSPSAIAKMDQMYPPTAADSKVTTRADGKQMIGANSPEAKAMREPSGSPEADAQFLKTLNKLNSGPDKTSVFRGVDYDPASTAARAERSGGAQPTVTQPSVTQPSGGNMGGSRPSKEVAEERQSQQEAEDKKWGWNMSGSKPTATTSVTTPLDNGSNVLLANDPLKQTGGPIPQLFGGGVGGGVPTDADVLKDLKRKRFGIAAFGDDPAEWGL